MTLLGVGTIAGAVYVTLPSALDTIVPIWALPPEIPLTVQLTPVLLVPATVSPTVTLLVTRTEGPAFVNRVRLTFPGPTTSETTAEFAAPGLGLLIIRG